MSSDSEDVTNFLYSKAAQLLFGGASKRQVVDEFQSKEVPENIAMAIVDRAADDLIARADELVGDSSDSDQQNPFREICRDLKEQDGKTIPFVVARELEKFTTKNDLLNAVNPSCLVITDYERIDVPNDDRDKAGIYGRNKAWQRIYDIEGSDQDLKIGMLQKLSKEEYDGVDYLVINLQIDDGTLIKKQISPNGGYVIVRINGQGEMSLFQGCIDED